MEFNLILKREDSNVAKFWKLMPMLFKGMISIWSVCMIYRWEFAIIYRHIWIKH
jgi:hypothetical protein